jgi:hypothetical protein
MISHLVASLRSYKPETLAVMMSAFDAVIQSTSMRIDCDEEVRRTLALIILRKFDQGEHDPKRLSRLASAELAGLVGLAVH